MVMAQLLEPAAVVFPSVLVRRRGSRSKACFSECCTCFGVLITCDLVPNYSVSMFSYLSAGTDSKDHRDLHGQSEMSELAMPC